MQLLKEKLIKKSKLWFLPLLAVAIASVVFVSGVSPVGMRTQIYADNEIFVGTFNELLEAINKVPENTPTTIYITSSFEITETVEIGTLVYPPEIPEGVNITIKSYGTAGPYTLTRSVGMMSTMGNSYDLFRVFSGSTLTFESIIIDGNSANVDDAKGPLVLALGAFNMNAGTTLGNNNNPNSSGGGVSVLYAGVFNMKGGTISDCYANAGGGVYVGGGDAPAFNMTGGKISGNTAVLYGGGGVHLGSNGIFNMTGGTISGNTSGSYGGGVFAIYVVDTTFTMTGGAICDNISGSDGGGVYLGASIGTFTLGDSAVIEGNTAGDSVGNIYIDEGRSIILGTGANAPASSMHVGVSKPGNSGIFVQSGAQAQDVNYFFADGGGTITHNSGRLIANHITAGSFSELLTAINNAPENTPTTIYITSSFDITGMIDIPEYKDIAIKSYGYTSPNILTRGITDHLFRVNPLATLTFENIIIDGNKANFANASGALVRTIGTLNMNRNTTLRNNSTEGGGGGVVVTGNGVFNMNGGAITGCTANVAAGVAVVGNSADVYPVFNMTGGTISGNTNLYLDVGGGGVYVSTNATFTMTGGTISDNTSVGNGGGVYYNAGTFILGGSAVIENNAAGGSADNVYVLANQYITLGTGANAPTLSMSVGVNTLNISGGFARSSGDYGIQPEHVHNFFADNGQTVAFYSDLLIQNGKFSSAVLEIVDEYYSITYNGNGSTSGDVPVDSVSYSPGTNAIALGNDGGLIRTGYVFSGWNTLQNGNGTSYAPGAMISLVKSNITLYAQWNPMPPSFVQHPKDIIVSEESPASFSALATSGPALAYNWEFSKNGDNDWEIIPDEKQNTLTIAKVTMDMNGYYFRCVATNSSGWVYSDVAKLLVTEAKEITVSEQQGVLAPGTESVAEFKVIAEGVADNTECKISWFEDAEGQQETEMPQGLLPNGPKVIQGVAMISIKADVLTEVGKYFFKVTVNDAVSDIVELTVIPAENLSGVVSITLNTSTGALTANTSLVTGGIGQFIYSWSGPGVTNPYSASLAPSLYSRGQQVTLTLTRVGTFGSLTAFITVYQVTSGTTVVGGTTGTFSITSAYGKEGNAVACSYSAGDSVSVAFASATGPVTLSNDNTAYTISSGDAESGVITITATFTAQDEPDIQDGDVNGDGSIDATDAMIILRYAVGLEELTPEQFGFADVNGDGFVDATDAMIILRYVAGLIDSLDG